MPISAIKAVPMSGKLTVDTQVSNVGSAAPTAYRYVTAAITVHISIWILLRSGDVPSSCVTRSRSRTGAFRPFAIRPAATYAVVTPFAVASVITLKPMASNTFEGNPGIGGAPLVQHPCTRANHKTTYA